MDHSSPHACMIEHRILLVLGRYQVLVDRLENQSTRVRPLSSIEDPLETFPKVFFCGCAVVGMCDEQRRGGRNEETAYVLGFGLMGFVFDLAHRAESSSTK